MFDQGIVIHCIRHRANKKVTHRWFGTWNLFVAGMNSNGVESTRDRLMIQKRVMCFFQKSHLLVIQWYSLYHFIAILDGIHRFRETLCSDKPMNPTRSRSLPSSHSCNWNPHVFVLGETPPSLLEQKWSVSESRLVMVTFTKSSYIWVIQWLNGIKIPTFHG